MSDIVLCRFFLEWQLYTRNRKRLSSSLEEFQTSHLKNDDGLLKKYMKIWKMKSSFSKQAENLVCLISLNKKSESLSKFRRHICSPKCFFLIFKARLLSKECSFLICFSITPECRQNIGKSGDITMYEERSRLQWFTMTIKRFYRR